MKIGVLTSSISRQAGGLFWSVRSLSGSVKRAGYDVQVFSNADAYSAEDAAQWGDLDICLLTRRGPKYFGFSPGFRHALDGAGLDLLHTHGLWMYPSLAGLRWSKHWNRPLVVSPRGMLDPWAVRNSAWKKHLVGIAFEKAHLRRAACLHALSDSEYRSIRDYGLKNPVAIIPNGVELPDKSYTQVRPIWSSCLPSNSRVLLFLSRIHPKKGLVNLLHAWAQARQQQSNMAESWHLVIAGWDQGGHQAELQQLSKNLGLEQSVHFVGPLFDEQKSASLAIADAFILPSFSEGLPMAVLEAWSYCLPVLITTQCNLPEGLKAEAALEMVPETGSIAATLDDLFEQKESERRAMGERGRKLVEDRFTWRTVAADMCAVYKWVLGCGAKPDCVITD